MIFFFFNHFSNYVNGCWLSLDTDNIQPSPQKLTKLQFLSSQTSSYLNYVQFNQYRWLKSFQQQDVMVKKKIISECYCYFLPDDHVFSDHKYLIESALFFTDTYSEEVTSLIVLSFCLFKTTALWVGLGLMHTP